MIDVAWAQEQPGRGAPMLVQLLPFAGMIAVIYHPHPTAAAEAERAHQDARQPQEERRGHHQRRHLRPHPDDQRRRGDGGDRAQRAGPRQPPADRQRRDGPEDRVVLTRRTTQKRTRPREPLESSLPNGAGDRPDVVGDPAPPADGRAAAARLAELHEGQQDVPRPRPPGRDAPDHAGRYRPGGGQLVGDRLRRDASRARKESVRAPKIERIADG